MPIRGEVGEDENGDAISASKCGCVPRAFVVPVCSNQCGEEGNKFAPVGLAALISCIIPTPTPVSELASLWCCVSPRIA
jgi:hypothetical protein